MLRLPFYPLVKFPHLQIRWSQSRDLLVPLVARFSVAVQEQLIHYFHRCPLRALTFLWSRLLEISVDKQTTITFLGLSFLICKYRERFSGGNMIHSLINEVLSYVKLTMEMNFPLWKKSWQCCLVWCPPPHRFQVGFGPWCSLLGSLILRLTRWGLDL